MSKVMLPYKLKDGQVAYANRVMANLQALADKLNGVTISGLAACDMETALQQIKYLLDAEYAADAKVVESFTYNGLDHTLELKLRDGAVFTINALPFLNDYSGAESGTIITSVNGARQISADIKPGGITYQMLAEALQQLLEDKVTAEEAGNAGQIVFADGETMQEKLDSGALRGADGVALAFDNYYSFRIGEDGHLYLGVAEGEQPPPLTIDENGRLIFSLEDQQ